MSTIGKRFRELRKYVKMNQEAFANSINVSQGTLSDIENDKFKPSIDTVISASGYFKIPTDWILTGTALVTEGIDVPIDEIIYLSKHFNTEEFIQAVGRVSRTAYNESENGVHGNEKITNVKSECQEKLLDYNMFVQSKMIQKDVSEEEGVLIDVYRDLPIDDKEEVKSIICYKHNRITSGLKKKETLSKSGHDEEAAAREFSEMKMA